MTTSGSDRPLGPFRLVTVNTAPERAKRIVGRLCEEVKDDYLIDHVANSTSELLPGAIYIPCRRRHLFLMARLTLFLLNHQRHRRCESHGRGAQAGHPCKGTPNHLTPPFLARPPEIRGTPGAMLAKASRRPAWQS